jgi:hypothetical protein
MKVGIHTPNATTTYYKYLQANGIDVIDVSWKNDTCDSFLFNGKQVMLPNTSEDITYNAFVVFNDEDYGSSKLNESLLEFTNVRELANYLKTI